MKISRFFIGLGFLLIANFSAAATSAQEEQIIPRENWSVIAEGYITKHFYDVQNNLWLVSRQAEFPDYYYLSKYDGQSVTKQIYFPAVRTGFQEGDWLWQTTAPADFAIDRNESYWVYSYDQNDQAKIYQWRDNQWSVFSDQDEKLDYNWQGVDLEIARQGDTQSSLPFKGIQGFYFDQDNNMWVAGTGEIKNEICPTGSMTRGCEDGKNWGLAIIGKYDGSNWTFFTEMDWNYPENLLDDMPDPNSEWNLYSINDSYDFWGKNNTGYIKVWVGRGTNKTVVLDFSNNNFSFEEVPSEISAWTIWEEDYSQLSAEESFDLLANPDYAALEAESRIFPGLNYFDGTENIKYQLEDFSASQFENEVIKADSDTVYFVNSDLAYEASFPPAMDGAKDFMLLEQMAYSEEYANLDDSMMEGYYSFFGGQEEYEKRLAKLNETKIYYNPDHYGEIRYTKIVKVDVGDIIGRTDVAAPVEPVLDNPVSAPAETEGFLKKVTGWISTYAVVGGALVLVLIISLVGLFVIKWIRRKKHLLPNNIVPGDNKILDYIISARNGGMTDENIKLNLQTAGWPEQEINNNLTK